MKRTVLCAIMVMLSTTGLRAQGCGPVSAPWWADFSTDSSFNCWTASGNATWTRNQSGTQYRIRVQFNSSDTGTWGQLLSQPIALPVDSTGLTLFWSEYRGNNAARVDSLNMTLKVLVTMSDSLSTAAFDTLYVGSAYQTSDALTPRTVSLSAYAGQTIRVAFVVEKSRRDLYRYMFITNVMVRNNRMPILAALTTPYVILETDQVSTCIARLVEGDTAGLHYTWSSLIGGVFTPRGIGDTATLVYGVGISGAYDTVTVTATNPFGSSTASRAVHVIDCTPATTLPWHEPFANGLHCWLRPWARQYASEWYVMDSSLRSACNSDTLDSWVISKAIVIPANVSDSVRLFWREWERDPSSTNYIYNYQVLATASNNYTDSTQYTILYAGGDLTNQPEVRSVSLAAYAGQTIHIAFHNQSGNTDGFVSGSAWFNAICIDNIEVRATLIPRVGLEGPTAVRSLERVSFTGTLTEGRNEGLVLSWHSTLLDTTWVDTLRTPVWPLHVTYPIGGVDTLSFTAANAYGSASDTLIVTVTECGNFVLPYAEDFDSVPAVSWYTRGVLPECWRKLWDGEDSYRAPHVISANGYPNMGNLPDNALMMLACNNTGYAPEAYVILPHFDEALSTLSLALDYRYQNPRQGVLEAGYFDDSLFVVVKPLAPHAGDYRRDTVYFDSATVPDARIVLRWRNNTSDYCRVAIDNLFVESHIDSIPVPPDTVWRTITATSADESMGSVSGGGLVPDSSMVTLVAEPVDLEGRVVFDQWNDGDTSNPRHVFVVSDTAFTAYFRVVDDSVGISCLQFPDSGLRLYPNPMHGIVTVACAGHISYASLTDMMGRAEQVHLTTRGEGLYTLDLTSHSQATYLLTLITADGRQYTVRLMKQQK